MRSRRMRSSASSAYSSTPVGRAREMRRAKAASNAAYVSSRRACSRRRSSSSGPLTPEEGRRRARERVCGYPLIPPSIESVCDVTMPLSSEARYSTACASLVLEPRRGRAKLTQRRARGGVGGRRDGVDPAVGVRLGVGVVVRAAERLVQQRAGVGEAVRADRGRRALVGPRRQRVAERAALALLATGRIAEAALVPPEASIEERRADERLARQADDLEGDLPRRAIAEIVEAQLGLVDARAAAAAVADGEREVLAPELEVLHRAAVVGPLTRGSTSPRRCCGTPGSRLEGWDRGALRV